MAIFLTILNLGICMMALTSLIAESNGLRCMQCFKAPHFAHCEETVNCNATQICYVEQRIVYGQTLVFAGCKDRAKCDSEGCFGEKSTVSTTRWSQGRELKCHHCCDSDFCNMYGCPDTSLFDGEVCNWLCTELAVVKGQLNNITSREKRQAVKFFSQCCSSHLCNRQDPINDAPVSPLSIDYQCPTPPPVTTSKTKQTTPTEARTTTQTTTTMLTTTTTPQKVVPTHEPDCRDKTVCYLYSKETACSLQWRDWARETCPKMCNLCSGSSFKRDGETSTKLSISRACRDLLDCSVYGRDYACRGDYVPWSTINCPLYCGFCSESSSTATIKAKLLAKGTSCVDKLDCSIYGKEYACQAEFEEWAILNCPNFCGLCNEERNKQVTEELTVAVTFSSTSGHGCVDKIDCTVYDKDYICTDEFKEWASINCPRFCGHCENSKIQQRKETETTVSATPVSSTAEGSTCTDKIDCTVYGRNYACSDEFREWASTNCPQFCGYCEAPNQLLLTKGPGASSPAPSSISTKAVSGLSCVDEIDCSVYGKSYACSEEFREWASIKCPRFCGYCEETSNKQLKTTKPELSTQVTNIFTGDGSICVDKIDCSVYGKNYACSKEFTEWAAVNCPRFCGLCTDHLYLTRSSTEIAPEQRVEKVDLHSADCSDKLDCSVYGKDYACSDEFKEWATENCPKFCGHCGDESPDKTTKTRTAVTTWSPRSFSSCTDKIDCTGYGYDYICTEEFRPWATENCPAFCDYCSKAGH